jgi:hypothetical protein
MRKERRSFQMFRNRQISDQFNLPEQDLYASLLNPERSLSRIQDPVETSRLSGIGMYPSLRNRQGLRRRQFGCPLRVTPSTNETTALW